MNLWQIVKSAFAGIWSLLPAAFTLLSGLLEVLREKQDREDGKNEHIVEEIKEHNKRIDAVLNRPDISDDDAKFLRDKYKATGDK